MRKYGKNQNQKLSQKPKELIKLALIDSNKLDQLAHAKSWNKLNKWLFSLEKPFQFELLKLSHSVIKIRHKTSISDNYLVY